MGRQPSSSVVKGPAESPHSVPTRPLPYALPRALWPSLSTIGPRRSPPALVPLLTLVPPLESFPSSASSAQMSFPHWLPTLPKSISKQLNILIIKVLSK